MEHNKLFKKLLWYHDASEKIFTFSLLVNNLRFSSTSFLRARIWFFFFWQGADFQPYFLQKNSFEAEIKIFQISLAATYCMQIHCRKDSGCRLDQCHTHNHCIGLSSTDCSESITKFREKNSREDLTFFTKLNILFELSDSADFNFQLAGLLKKSVD